MQRWPRRPQADSALHRQPPLLPGLVLQQKLQLQVQVQVQVPVPLQV